MIWQTADIYTLFWEFLLCSALNISEYVFELDLDIFFKTFLEEKPYNLPGDLKKKKKHFLNELFICIIYRKCQALLFEKC